MGGGLRTAVLDTTSGDPGACSKLLKSDGVLLKNTLVSSQREPMEPKGAQREPRPVFVIKVRFVVRGRDVFFIKVCFLVRGRDVFS